MYSKITRNTRRNATMNGKSRRPIVSERIKANSEGLTDVCRAMADSSRTGRINSSVVIVRRKMHPKTAKVL